MQRIDAPADQAETADGAPLPLLGELALRRRVWESVHDALRPQRAACSSAREKKKDSSMAAFSGESLPWMALRSIDVP